MWDGNMATPNGGMHAPGNPQNPQQHNPHQLHNPHQIPAHSQHQNGNPNHFNQNMSNNQMPPTDKHNPVGAWQRGGWDSGIHSGKLKIPMCSFVAVFDLAFLSKNNSQVVSRKL